MLGASIGLVGCGQTTHDQAQAAAGSPGGSDNAPMCEDARLDTESGIETCGRGAHQFEHRAKVGEGCTYDPALQDACNVDADCQKPEICQCQGPGSGGRCVPSECQTDAECQQGTWCSTFRSVCGIKAVYACGLPGDQCHVDGDCAPATPFCLPIPNPNRGGWNRICVESLPCPE